ncbi:phospholipid/cholesterol/gamma-HCH transport system ATP-binding protein [Spirosomataceae bacterium TFI 002]|nr:phospholipid/cholesterol/gamma-HCH transport system ATP-binding protein [Spirosomataceae bacterium TFI 002]
MEKVIEIRNLYKSFGKLDVLKGIDLDLYKGENLVVLGKSGTGKSVLIKIIVGLIKQDKGTCEVLGEDVSALSKKDLDQLRARVGFSFQHSALYDSMSIEENLEFPLRYVLGMRSKKEMGIKVDKVLEDVGLSQAKFQRPSELSGGQRKRIGIARTVIVNPEIVLYDEPTAGLDPITCIEINELINEIKENYGTSSIVITHDLTCAKQTGDRLAMLLDGKFHKVGTFEEVFDGTDPQIQSFYNYNFVQ